jgi:hypothetical protein
VHEGAEHVQQHAFAAFLDDLQDLHVHQRGEDDRPLPSTSAVWLIWRTAWWALSAVSMKGRRTWRGLHFELGQDGVAKGLGGDAGAVGDEKYGALAWGLS